MMRNIINLFCTVFLLFAVFVNANAQDTTSKAQLAEVISLADIFGIDTTDANALLADDNATVEEIEDAFQALCESAMTSANKFLSDSGKFFDVFDKETATLLADDFAALETALEGNDISAIEVAVKNIIAKATPAAKIALQNILGYLEVIDYENLSNDLSSLKIAMDNDNFIDMLVASKLIRKDLVAVVPGFLYEVNAVIELGRQKGLDVTALVAAYNAASYAILEYMQSDDQGDIVSLGEAIYNLVIAYNAYREDNPLEDIDINVAEGDIAAALALAVEGKNVGNITIRLNKDAAYTIGATMTAPGNIFIYGNGATVTVPKEMTDNFITLDGTAVFAKKADATNSDHKLIRNVEVWGLNIKGLKGALVKDNQKTLVENILIDGSNIEISAARKDILDFNEKGYAGKVTLTNSTVWAKGKTTGFFAHYGSRPRNVNGNLLQEFVFQNNTIVNIAKGTNFNKFDQRGTAKNAYTVKNNIFVDCGKQNETVVGINAGQTSANPVWDVTGNHFLWGGLCVNKDEIAKAGKKDEEDIVKNCVEGTLKFVDAARGNFNGKFELAEDAEAPQALGAPMWTITFVSAPVSVGCLLVDPKSTVIYNMAGQKVTKAGKGLFIVNGKSIIMH